MRLNGVARRPDVKSKNNQCMGNQNTYFHVFSLFLVVWLPNDALETIAFFGESKFFVLRLVRIPADKQ